MSSVISQRSPSINARSSPALTAASISAPEYPSVTSASSSRSNSSGSRLRLRRCTAKISRRSSSVGRSTKTMCEKRPCRVCSAARPRTSLAVPITKTSDCSCIQLSKYAMVRAVSPPSVRDEDSRPRVCRREPPCRVGGHLTERGDDLVAYPVVGVKDRLFRFVQIVAGFVEDRLKLGKSLPRNPAVSGRLEESLGQPEVITIFMKRGMGLGDRREERPAVTIGQEAAARRPERDVGLFRELDAERLPVEPAVEDAETSGVDINEQSFFFKHREIEGEALDLFSVTPGTLGRDCGAAITVRDDGGGLCPLCLRESNDTGAHESLLVTIDVDGIRFGGAVADNLDPPAIMLCAACRPLASSSLASHAACAPWLRWEKARPAPSNAEASTAGRICLLPTIPAQSPVGRVSS